MAKTNGKVEEPMLEPDPEHTIQIHEPGSIKETVNQKRLREFYDLEQQYLALRDEYFVRLNQIQDLIIRGANIQQGTYKIQYGKYQRRHPRYKQALIDVKGEAYQQRILNGTAPYEFFRVKIE